MHNIWCGNAIIITTAGQGNALKGLSHLLSFLNESASIQGDLQLHAIGGFIKPDLLNASFKLH